MNVRRLFLTLIFLPYKTILFFPSVMEIVILASFSSGFVLSYNRAFQVKLFLADQGSDGPDSPFKFKAT